MAIGEIFFVVIVVKAPDREQSKNGRHKGQFRAQRGKKRKIPSIFLHRPGRGIIYDLFSFDGRTREPAGVLFFLYFYSRCMDEETLQEKPEDAWCMEGATVCE